jgi:hypothetical protein
MISLWLNHDNLLFITILKSYTKCCFSITYSNLKSRWCLIIYKALYLFGYGKCCYLSTRGVIGSYIPRSAKLVLVSISHVDYLCPSKGKFLEFSRHYYYHGLDCDIRKILIRIVYDVISHIGCNKPNY